MSGKRVKHGPFTMEIVQGDPVWVEGRELVPLVRVTSRVRRRASVCSDGVSGGGWGFVHMRPVAIVDRSGSDEQRLQVRNEAAGSILWLSVILLVVPVLFYLLVNLLPRSDGKTS